MGSWGYGSGDKDGAHDWYRSTFVNYKLIPPTSKALNQDLAKWLKIKVTELYDEAEFLGIVVLALADQVKVSKAFLKKAFRIAEFLVNTPDYLNRYDNPSRRKKSLQKEIKAIAILLNGMRLSRPKKLKQSLFEAFNDESRFSKNTKKPQTKTKKKAARPAPMASATEFKPGTKKKGGNGKIWVVTFTKSKVHRWSPI